MSSTYIPVAVRQLVYGRANAHCEYCLIPEDVAFAPHEIDHIIAEKHGGPTEDNNLALSCTLCNKYKGSDIASVDPYTETIVPLYHPRQNQWFEHFRLNGAEFVIGRVTIQLLQLNHPNRIEERKLLIMAGRLGLQT